LLNLKSVEQAVNDILPPKEQVLPAARTEAGERALTPANNKDVVSKPTLRLLSDFMDGSKRNELRKDKRQRPE
jgi:hypothetical protein